MKYEYKVSVDADMATRITMAHERIQACKRKVSRNDVIVQLLEDGFSQWQGHIDVNTRLEATVAKIAARMEQQDRMLRSILLTLAEGDKEEYRNDIAEIEKMENENV